VHCAFQPWHESIRRIHTILLLSHILNILSISITMLPNSAFLNHREGILHQITFIDIDALNFITILAADVNVLSRALIIPKAKSRQQVGSASLVHTGLGRFSNRRSEFASGFGVTCKFLAEKRFLSSSRLGHKYFDRDAISLLGQKLQQPQKRIRFLVKFASRT
jgi:hypothetical protein